MKYQFKNIRGLKQARVSPEDVIMVEANENYSVFYFSNGRRITLAKTLKQCEGIFEPYRFYRIHRSCLINLRHCTHFSETEIFLNGNLKGTLARRRKDGFLLTIRALKRHG